MFFSFFLCFHVCFTCSVFFFFFKQKTAYEVRISDWSSDVCSSDLIVVGRRAGAARRPTTIARNGSWQRHARTMAISQATRPDREGVQIGRASCRERVCQYV